MNQPIVYRDLHQIDELQIVTTLQAKIWAFQPEMIVPTHMLHSLIYGGGCLIGADIGGAIVGFVLGFPARRGGTWILWSHMAGVLPEYQGRTIGFSLKMAQRAWALRSGFDTIAWTFDPMQARNAQFNLRRLCATASRYHADFYGEMPDMLNAGLPTDRLEVIWALKAPRVQALDRTPELPAMRRVTRDRCALYQADGGALLAQPVESQSPSPVCFVEVPADIGHLKQRDFAHAQQWQLALRRTLSHLFEIGCVASDFTVEDDHHYFVLTNDSSS